MTVAAPQRVSHLAILASGSVAPGGHLTADGGFTAPALELVWFGQDGDTSYERFAKALRTQVIEPEHLPEAILEQAYQDFTSSGRCDEYVRKMKAFDPLAYYHKQDPQAFADKLRQIPVPTTVIWGREDDTSTYDKAMDLLPIFPDVELHVLPRGSHFIQLDRPTEVANLIVEFLGRD
jgi:2-hydroxy-6-oxonona-2,4-dienedioate hydrolase/4,5:9,10-diseco-3-hydroxy-5,9,17-trioxoandrosta-1(10),2-diene-4-oate hydrolase